MWLVPTGQEPRWGRRGGRLEPSLSPGQWPQPSLLWPLSRCPAHCPQWGLSRLQAPQPAGFCPLCPSSKSQSCRQRSVCFPPRDSALAPRQPRPGAPRPEGQMPEQGPRMHGPCRPGRGPPGSPASGAHGPVCGRGIKRQGTWRASRRAECGRFSRGSRQDRCGAGVGRASWATGQSRRARGPCGGLGGLAKCGRALGAGR